MMVLDRSAILVILLDEPERASVTRLMAQDSTRLVSAATLVENSMMIECRNPAGQNFGDVFAYALTETTSEPLLFQSNDPAGVHIANAA